MISPELRIEGWDQESWTTLMGLVAPGIIERMRAAERGVDDPRASAHAEQPHRGALVICVDDHEEVLAAFHTIRGRADDVSGTDDLERLADEFGARRVWVVREGALEELVERLALRLRPDDDYASQWLTLLRIYRELADAGRVRTWPPPPRRVPVPTLAALDRAMELLLPDGRALVLTLWNHHEVCTAMVLRRRGGDLDLVAGPDLLREWVGPLGGDFRRDYRVLVDAVNREVAPVHLGLFAELETLRRLLRRPDPGSWATAITTREVVLSPMPPYVAVALGADVANGAARGLGALLGGVDLLGGMRPLLGYVRGRVSEIASLTSTLGFNPLASLAHSLQRRDETPESTSRAHDDG